MVIVRYLVAIYFSAVIIGNYGAIYEVIRIIQAKFKASLEPLRAMEIA